MGGKTLTVRQWGETLGVNHKVVSARISKKWVAAEAILTPIAEHGSQSRFRATPRATADVPLEEELDPVERAIQALRARVIIPAPRSAPTRPETEGNAPTKRPARKQAARRRAGAANG